MTRDMVIRGLTRLLDSVTEKWWLEPFHDALRSAIALLTVPSTADVEAARDVLALWRSNRGGSTPGTSTVATLDRALDALAREPGFEESLAWEAGVNKALLEFQEAWCRERREKDNLIAALSAKLARVREECEMALDMEKHTHDDEATK